MPTAYAHQVAAARFLAERRFALLADDPGLGKTASCVLATDMAGIERVLVVCPGAVRRHWEAEFLRWQSVPRKVNVQEGYLSAPPAARGVTVVSHAALSDAPRQAERVGSVSWLAAGAPYDLVIVDESAEFRRYAAARTVTLLGPGGLASRSARTWLISGTPVVNSAADLYPLVAGAIGSSVGWQEFCEYYCVMVPDAFQGSKPTGIRNEAELAAGLRPYVLRRTIESLGLPMPALDIRKVPLAVPAGDMARIVAGLEGWSPDRLRAALESQDDLRDSEMARVRRALGTAKAVPAAYYAEHLLACGSGPLVVFFQHTDVRKAMHAEFLSLGRTCAYIDGSVTSKSLNAAKGAFQAGQIDVLLVQTQAGGQGLTLTRSHRALVAEMPWTAKDLFQAVKRVHRISQTRDCTGDILCAQDCWLEDALFSTVTAKQRASDKLLSLLTSSI